MHRFWEIDFLRGVAIIMMLIYHTIFDLTFFGNYSSKIFMNYWYWFGRVTAILFIFLVGVSLTLSYSRAKKKGKANFYKYLRRGIKIFSIGLLIFIITFVLFPKYFIVFGILHFIGLSVILGYFLVKPKYKYLTLALGIFIIFFGLYLSNFTFNFYWLLWLGLIPKNFQSFDYYPLFPYFGFVLIGISLGNFLYPNYKRKFNLPELSSWYLKFICWLGRNSLKIYLMHQPIIILILLLVGLIDIQIFLYFR
jgi:uncharacterized membrane protein